MIASLLIIGFSAALMLYWFRYTCLLILKTRTSKDYASDMATANRLQFAGVSEQVVSRASRLELSALERSLHRDYRLLTYLLASTAGANIGGLTLEQRLLTLDFWLMRMLFGLTRLFGLRRARAAILEMAEVLTHLANALGERVHAASGV